MDTKITIKWSVRLSLSVFMMAFMFCSDNNAQAMENQEQLTTDEINGKILVAYFSRANYVPEGTDGVTGATNKAGNTQTVADYIKQKTNGDIFEIVPERDYPVSHSECSAIAQQEARENERPALATHIDNMDDYNIIFVGFPIWVYREPMAVLTFLEEYDFTGKTVIPFCTSMAVDIDQSMEDFRNTLPDVDIKNGLRLNYTLSGDWQAEVDGWLERIGISTHVAQESYKVRMTFGNHSLTATLENNATTRAFIERLPITLPMMDLYGREMCYRFPEALPTDNAFTQGYEVGEIVYYPPMHSFVILYAQNGERFQMQKLGRVDSDIELFDGVGDVDVRFELLSSTTAIKQIKNNAATVKTSGHKIIVDGEGTLNVTAYSSNGMVVGKAFGTNHVEMGCYDRNGVTIVEVIDGNEAITRTKISM